MSTKENPIDEYFEGQLIEVLYSMDHKEDIRNISIGDVHSQSHEGDAIVIENRVDKLLKELGAKGIHWSRILIGGATKNDLGNPNFVFREADKRHFELNGITAGKFLTELIYEKLPIEWDEEGEARASLSMWLPEEYVLNLKGEGTFHTAYIYDNESADIDDEPSDSEIVYTMSFKADMFTVRP